MRRDGFGLRARVFFFFRRDARCVVRTAVPRQTDVDSR